MAKKQASIYFHDDIYNWLIDYKERNGLSNLSVTIERLVLERIFKENGCLDTPIESIKRHQGVKVESKASKLLKNLKEGMPN